MNLIGKLKVGTIFTGNVNHIKMKVMEIKSSDIKGDKNQTALVKELSTGKVFAYGLQTLERCDLTIVKSEEVK